MRLKTILILLVVSVFWTACSGDKKNDKAKFDIPYQDMEPKILTVKEYQKVLFDIDTADFKKGLESLIPEYSSVLGTSINDIQAKYVKAFVTDTFCRHLYEMVDEKFSDIEPISKDIQTVCQRFNYYFPGNDLPEVITYISGIDYEMGPVTNNGHAILISLDYYLGNEDNIYDYIGMPRFRSLRCRPEYITKDLAVLLYMHYIYDTHIYKNIITEMVEKGKMYYFVEAMNPSLPDSILLGYSEKQMDWAKNNEGNLWASLVGDNLLYANKLTEYQQFFGDGPFTQAYSNDAPSRLGDFIGLQIIRSYMNNNDVTLQELMDNKDLLQIFQDSNYKPKK